MQTRTLQEQERIYCDSCSWVILTREKIYMIDDEAHCKLCYKNAEEKKKSQTHD